jgi:hypothetical protein
MIPTGERSSSFIFITETRKPKTENCLQTIISACKQEASPGAGSGASLGAIPGLKGNITG